MSLLYQTPGVGRHTRLEDHACPNGRDDALRQENLPILLADTRHHDAKHMQEAPDQHQPSWTVAVVQHADDGTHAEDEEDLQGWDPGDGAGGVGGEQLGLVVGLEDADAVEPAEAGEGGAPGAEHAEPGGEATIWRAVRESVRVSRGGGGGKSFFSDTVYGGVGY